MSDHEAQARAFVAKGEKKLSSLGWFSNKHEDAAECFEKAGNLFKLSKSWNEAGEAFLKLAACRLKTDGQHEAAVAYVEASRAFGRGDRRRAVPSMEKAVELYTEMGRLGMAARQLRDAGEAADKAGDKDGALPFFERAAELFETDHAPAEGNRCSLRVAQLAAELGRYAQAAVLFERSAKAAVESHLLRYSAKGYLLNAGICEAAASRGDARQLLDCIDRYCGVDASFEGSREHKLLAGIQEALDKGDPDLFSAHVADFDAMTRLEPWKTTVLLQAKRSIVQGPGGLGGGGAPGGGAPGAPGGGLDEDDLT